MSSVRIDQLVVSRRLKAAPSARFYPCTTETQASSIAVEGQRN